jgi:hypothetical protein
MDEGAIMFPSVQQDVSPPLRSMMVMPPADGPPLEGADHEPPESTASPAFVDPVAQMVAAISNAPTPSQSFDGLGVGFHGPAGTFRVQYTPPDPNGDVGPNHYLQTVNAAFTILSKDGTPLYGPANINSLFSGFGGPCETSNSGDPVVKYDALADRWVISQFAITGPPDYQCVAVSTTPDPTGSYNRYAFRFNALNDYPKLGVWPDGYYFTINLFAGGGETGQVCVFDRNAMLTGSRATAQCFDAPQGYDTVLTSDLVGRAQPPQGTPAFAVALDNDALALWKLTIDWGNPSASRMSGPTAVPVAAFAPAGSPTQPGGGQLSNLSDRLMYRLSYRRFADHESLMVDHSVYSSSRIGMRWYEIRDPNGTPRVFQQGTYAPDGESRWNGSLNMDHDGNIAMGFSVTSSQRYPSVHYAGRLVSDPPGTMPQGEGSLVEGGGAQQGATRWGDYSSMSVDPSDDCTFWYTTQYIAASGPAPNWHTRIGSFRFPSCGGTVGQNDFSLTITPGSQSLAAGASVDYTVTTAVIQGSAETVMLQVSGLPAGVTGSFNPAQVTAGGTSTLTLSAAADAATATASVTVTGSSPSANHSAIATVQVSGGGTMGGDAVTNGGFETGDLSGWSWLSGVVRIRQPPYAHSGGYSARVGSITGYLGDSVLNQTIRVPSGSPQLSFWYLPRCYDDVQWDQLKAQVLSTDGQVLATLLNVCENGNWVHVTTPMTSWAGQTVVLSFSAHDDGNPADPTWWYIDDVSVTN